MIVVVKVIAQVVVVIQVVVGLAMAIVAAGAVGKNLELNAD